MTKQFFTRHSRLIGFIIGAIIYALLPSFVHSPYYLDLFIMVLLNAVLGMTFIMTLRTGLINLGIAPFWGIGAYISTVLSLNLHQSFWVCLPASALLTALFGLVIGYILMKSGGTGFGFIMLSSVIGMLFVVTIGNIKFLGAYNGIQNIPPPDPIHIPFLPPIEFVSRVQFLYLALVIYVIIVLIANAFYAAWTGRAWTATGLNPRLAESLGVNIFRYKLLAFVVSCGILGLIGSFWAHYGGFVIPTTFGMWVNIYIQIYAILGGLGYATLGPLVGAGIMTFFPEMMRITKEVAPVFTGAVLVLLILFLPKGILSLLDRQSWLGERVIKIGKTLQSSLSTGRSTGKV
jgi:branched-chain amino acid transport system permease protein